MQRVSQICSEPPSGPPALARADRAWPCLAVLGALLLAWGLLHRAPLFDLLGNASAESLRLNLIIGVGLAALVGSRIRTVALRPAPRIAPLFVVAVCTVAHLGLTRTVDIDLLSCASMVLGAWGLVGLFLPRRRWLQALPLALAGVCILPMGAALDVYLGFPLRVATAHLVHTALEPLGLRPVSAETIVLLEGAGVQVDVPCSGVRSLWSGAILWAAITWIERRRIGLAWIGAGLVFAGLLVGLNAARVLALVLLHGLAPPAAMEVLHVPLGLCAFATAGLLGWALLRRLPAAPAVPEPAASPSRGRILWGLVALLLALSALPVAAPVPVTPVETIELPDPALHPIELQPKEAALFRARHARAAGKWEVSLDGAQGQLVMVQGSSFRSQHRPDLCHLAAGRSVEQEIPVLLGPDLPARQLRLRGEGTEAIAVYWFQSAERTTNEYGARIWAALDGDAEDWMMVSVMVQPPLPLDDPQLAALLQRVHAHAHTQLTDVQAAP